ncbi:hypothetical protein DFA_12064 [Cavenderia fasciculata]|uniref:EGF-like domain-containing protein n=1 Tax=Cavenderia fasciculata TaxID=261658 RepID=F4QFJ3_CACFS|nr:uncharacterized protein DFA_12064 [Cavenderia fasciculata]EGG14294.1 hypothetical protein DFA_12064 [Cavenderia fasciculata]|eukprot:XP_004351003.1 hypothetical protein DFA_12064 [Cavenderia fasciculata]
MISKNLILLITLFVLSLSINAQTPVFTFTTSFSEIGSFQVSISADGIVGGDLQTNFTYYVNNTIFCDNTPNTSCFIEELLSNSYYETKVVGVNGNGVTNTSTGSFTTASQIVITSYQGVQTLNNYFTVEWESTGGKDAAYYEISVNGTSMCQDTTADNYCEVDLTPETVLSTHSIELKAFSDPDSSDSKTFTFQTYKQPLVRNISATIIKNGSIELTWTYIYGNTSDLIDFGIDHGIIENDLLILVERWENTTLYVDDFEGSIHYFEIAVYNANFDGYEDEAFFNFTSCVTNNTATGFCSGNGICRNATLGCSCDQGWEGPLCSTKTVVPNSSDSKSDEVSFAFTLESSIFISLLLCLLSLLF